MRNLVVPLAVTSLALLACGAEKKTFVLGDDPFGNNGQGNVTAAAPAGEPPAAPAMDPTGVQAPTAAELVPDAPAPSGETGPTSAFAGSWQEWHTTAPTGLVSFISVANNGSVSVITGHPDGTPLGDQARYSFDEASNLVTRRHAASGTLQHSVYRQADFVLSAALRETTLQGFNYTQTVARVPAGGAKASATTKFHVALGTAKATITRTFSCDAGDCLNAPPASSVLTCLRIDAADATLGFDSDLGFNVFSCKQSTEAPTFVLFDEQALVFGEPEIALLRARFAPPSASFAAPFGLYRTMSSVLSERRHVAALEIVPHTVRPLLPLVSSGTKLNLGFDAVLQQFRQLQPEAGGTPGVVTVGLAANAYVDAMIYDAASSDETHEVYRGVRTTGFPGFSRDETTISLLRQSDGTVEFTHERRFCTAASCAGTTPLVTTGSSALGANGIAGLSTLTIPKGSSTVNVAYAPRKFVGLIDGGDAFVRVGD